MCGEFTWIADKVSNHCDMDVVGVRFLWSKIDNDACISQRLVLRNVQDFVVSHDED